MLHLWYADDASCGGNLSRLHTYFKRLQELGPVWGYFPEPSKSELIVPEKILAKATEDFQDLGFHVLTGTRFLGGFVGSPAAQYTWLESKVLAWTEAVNILSDIARYHPQTAYAGLQRSLQAEWCEGSLRRSLGKLRWSQLCFLTALTL